MKKLFLITAALVSAFLFCSCNEEDEPKVNQDSEWTKFDEAELDAIHVLYDSLHLADCCEYKDWSIMDSPGYVGQKGGGYFKNVTKYYGLTHQYDSLTNRYIVTSMKFSVLPQRDDISLPDVFGSFKHLKSFIMEVPDGASIVIPKTLCDCPLTTLKITPAVWESANIVKSPLPENFGNLAETLESLEICQTELGNDLLEYVKEFKNLKECTLRDNNFTGKVPYLPWANAAFCFNNNHFTEFDWRYVGNYQEFDRLCIEDWSTVPRFRYNEIEGPLPSYINQEFFYLLDRKDYWRPGWFLETFLGFNPIIKEYLELYTKYTGQIQTLE